MASSKTLNIKVKYQNQIKEFVCKHHELEELISSHFKINLRNFIMFAVVKGEKHQISLHDVTDLMKIIIDPAINGQHTMQESDACTIMIENIVSKLQQNTPFNVQERRAVIEALQTHGTSLFKKRKLHSTNICKNDTPECFNKKVQVQMAKKQKHSFVQTDPAPIASKDDNCINDDSNDKEPHLRRKRLRVQENVSNNVDDLMQKTYDQRRSFIHEGPPVSEIKKVYPILFCVEQIKKELDRLFYPGKSEEFLRNVNIYAKHILHYKDSKTVGIFKKIEKAHSHAKTPQQKTYIEMVGSALVLAKLLTQKTDKLGFIHLSDQPLSEKIENYSYPYIHAAKYKLKDIFSDEIHYDIMVEGEHFCGTSNFCEAILCLLASFFIFLIPYPERCCNTLIAFEKLYLEAKETEVVDEYTEKLIEFYKDKAVSNKERVVT